MAYGRARPKGLRMQLLALIVAPGLAAASQAHAQAGSAPAASQPAASQELGEVVVTAEKRTTNVQRTPDAITALSGRAMALRGQTSLNDLAASVPNLSFTSNAGASQIYIRGVGNTVLVPGADPGVAFYQDGAYVSDQWAANVGFYDEERIEVLRGPQGSLYGRNATGGAVNVISAPPTARFEGQVGVVAGDYGDRESEGFLSGPLGDSGVLARFSYSLNAHDGYTPNLLAGTPGAPDRVDDLSTQAFRLQFVVPVGASGSLKVIGSFFNEDDNGPTEKVLYDPNLPSQLLFGLSPNRDPRTVASQIANLKRRVYSLTTQYDQSLGSANLTIIGAYRKGRLDQVSDLDGTAAPQAVDGLLTNSDDYDIDARLASDGARRFSWIVGATYVNFRQSRLQDFEGFLPLGYVAPGQPLNIAYPLSFQLGGALKSQSVAAYLDTHYRLTDKLTLAAGVRITSDSKQVNEFQVFNGALVQDAPSKTWSSPSAKVGLEYQADPDLMIYANLARGFKSGAIAVGGFTTPARPEIVDNAEVGAKSTFWDDRVQLDVAGFISAYQDMQVFQVGYLTAVLTNAARATIGGAEVEARVKPAPGLSLDGSFGFDDATYGSFVSPDLRHGLPAVNVAGNQLPIVSKYQVHLGAEYDHAIGDGFLGTVRVDYAWRDKYYFTQFNTPDAMQGAYGEVGLSASLSPANGRWRLYAYGLNLTNQTTINAMTIVSPIIGSSRQVNLNPPRRFGVGLTFNF